LSSLFYVYFVTIFYLLLKWKCVKWYKQLKYYYKTSSKLNNILLKELYSRISKIRSKFWRM